MKKVTKKLICIAIAVVASLSMTVSVVALSGTGYVNTYPVNYSANKTVKTISASSFTEADPIQNSLYNAISLTGTYYSPNDGYGFPTGSGNGQGGAHASISCPSSDGAFLSGTVMFTFVVNGVSGVFGTYTL